MAQPVGAYLHWNSRKLGSSTDDQANTASIEAPAATGGENWIIGTRALPKRSKFVPQRRRQNDCSGAPILTEYRDLTAIVARTDITPAKSARFRNPQPGDIKNPNQNKVSLRERSAEQAEEIALRNDSFREAVFVTGQREFGSRVRCEVPDPMTETKEASDTSQRPSAGDRRQAFLDQLFSETLKVAQRNLPQRLAKECTQPLRISSVAVLGMLAGLALQPEFDDFRIAGRYHNRPYVLLLW
jgi:hypothetical protein